MSHENRNRRSCRSALGHRLHIEPLEDRRMLAVITVTSLADNLSSGGGVTLREAVLAANFDASVDGSVAGSGADTIEFDAAVFATPRTISLELGEIEITEAVTIDATSLPQNVTIDAQQNSRVLNFSASSGDLTLAGLTLIFGRTTGDNVFPAKTYSGGAIRFLSDGDLTLTNSIVGGNSTVGLGADGGGIYSLGSVTLTDSIVSGNRTTGQNASGGGITSSGEVTLTSSTVSGNSTAGMGAPGGGIYAHSSSIFSIVTLTDSTVSGNSTTGHFGQGGGIHSISSSVRLYSSIVSGNSTMDDFARGGGIRTFSGDVTLTNSTLSGNSTAGDNATGGGIYTRFGAVTLTNSTLNGNSTAGHEASGGGIYNYGVDAVTLTDSTISGNRTTGSGADGGGIRSGGSVTLTDSTVSENSTTGFNAGGGGIRSDGSVTLTDSTVSGNSTAGNFAGGGGIRSDGDVMLTGSTVSGNSTEGPAATGGGIRSSGNVSFTQSTVSGNSTAGSNAQGGGVYSGGTATLTGSTVSGNITTGNSANGGGISSGGDVTLNYSTVTANFASNAFLATGGGIWNFNDSITITNSIVAGNTAAGGMNDINPGTGTLDVSFSLIGDPSGTSLTPTGGAPGAHGNIVGGDAVELQVTIDFAAFGDFELSDLFDLSYTIDGGSMQPLFTSSVDEAGSQSYTLEDGTIVMWNDPLLVNGTTLSNEFQTLTATIPGATPGASVEIVFVANANGGGEAFVFRNIAVTELDSGSLVAQALATGSDVNVTFSQDDPDYGINDDIFGIRSRTNPGTPGLPRPIVDDSVANPPDTDGIIRSTDTADFFGVADTVNGTGNDTNIARWTLLVPSNPLDLLLGPLQNNGGRTETHAPLVGSPAIDAGDPSFTAPPDFDQRGAPFVRVADGGVNGQRIDIGAYERQSVAGLNLVVDTTVDENDGDYTAGDLSLREAVRLASGSIGANTVTFDPTVFTGGANSLIRLGGTELEITDTLTIDGTTGVDVVITGDADDDDVTDAANTTDVSASFGGAAGAPDDLLDDNSRVLNFSSTTGDLTLKDLTITGGRTTDDNLFIGGAFETTHSGGGIRFVSDGALNLTGSTVIGNSTTGSIADGGGIFTTSGTVTVTSSTVSGNSTTGIFAYGGGIYTFSGTVTLTSSTVSGNSTTGSSSDGGGISTRSGIVTLTSSTVIGNSTTGNNSVGGGIRTSGGAVTLTSSTVSGNSTTDTAARGGGIYTYTGAVTLTSSTVSGNSTAGVNAGGGGIGTYTGAVTLTSSTVSGNNSGDKGGGISTAFGAVTLTSSTVSGNEAAGAGGGVFVDNNGFNPSFTIENSIVAGNTDTGGTPNDLVPDPDGTLTINYSLIGVDDILGPITGNVGNQTGTAVSPLDPLLGPLANNGGPTLTHALLAGSLAIDAGDPGVVFDADEFDQRGAPFVRVFDGGVDGLRIDIGAYERQTVASLDLTVDMNLDENDGDYTAGDLSLREAIGLANGSLGANTILFDTALSGQTITLGGSELEINEAVTIDATALAGNVTVDANQQSRIFNITATTGDFTLAGLTLTGGRTIASTLSDSGGAIHSLTSGSLTIDQSTVSGNSTVGNFARGGGIYSQGAVTLTDSTVSGNSTVGFGAYGGGIRSGGAVTLTNSTVSGNSTAGNAASGGGISAYSNVTLNDSTVSGNSTVGSDFYFIGAIGGGISSFGSVTLTSSTVSGNSTAGDFAHGGGIYSSGDVMLTSSTVTDNHAYYSNATGGGIFNFDDTITITNSIVAGNTAGGGMDDIRPGTGTFSVNFSLIGTGVTPDAGTSGNNGVTNNPMLGVLADNGGPTETHALLAGSLAIDSGDPSSMSGVGGVPMFDQRGMPFGRVEDGDGNMTSRIDMGAYEVQSTTPTCDFDGMNGCNIDDIDALVMEIVAGTNSSFYDLTNDGLVNLDDRDQWLADAGALNLTSGNPYLLGDSNLDGTVDGQDFLVWNDFKFTPTGKWSQADWNADGITGGQDFLIWNANKFQSSDGILPSVLPSASHRSREIAPTVDVQTSKQSPTRLLGLSPIVPSTNTKRIDAVFARFHQREEHVDEQRQADIFDALNEDFPWNEQIESGFEYEEI